MYSISYSKKIDNISPVKFKVIKLFIDYCVNYLDIKQDFKVYLFHRLDNSIPEGITLACYNPNNNDIHVRTDNRYFYDVCRSIAHELVHLKQNQNDEIDWEKFTNIGGICENEANFEAGILCKLFVQENNAKWIYKMS